jgi:hypothetical protein
MTPATTRRLTVTAWARCPAPRGLEVDGGDGGGAMAPASEDEVASPPCRSAVMVESTAEDLGREDNSGDRPSSRGSGDQVGGRLAIVDMGNLHITRRRTSIVTNVVRLKL